MAVGDVIDRWMRLEMGRIMEGLVPVPKPLPDLLGQPEPKVATRASDPHRFNPDSLQWLWASLNPLTRARLQLPITVYLDHETPGDCYVTDEAAVRALQELGLAAGSPREGKLWMSLPRARDFAHQRPSLLQFMPR